MDYLETLRQGYIALGEAIVSMYSVVQMNVEHIASNSVAIASLEKYTNSIASFAVESLTEFAEVINTIGGIAVDNIQAITDLQIGLSHLAYEVTQLGNFVTIALSLSAFNTVMLITLFIMTLRKKKEVCSCKTLKPVYPTRLKK